MRIFMGWKAGSMDRGATSRGEKAENIFSLSGGNAHGRTLVGEEAKVEETKLRAIDKAQTSGQ